MRKNRQKQLPNWLNTIFHWSTDEFEKTKIKYTVVVGMHSGFIVCILIWFRMNIIRAESEHIENDSDENK